jgi:tetratricopeptide (TPR) repeat protein
MSAPPEDLSAWRQGAVVAAAALAVYAPTVSHRFVFDDDIVVVKNRLIRSLSSVPELVGRTEWAGGGLEVLAYRPLTGVTYALNHAVSGLSPWSYHLANALLHALASALVLALGLRLRLGAAAAGVAALLFAVHPIHVEAVSNVVGRKDVLATVLVLAMALAHRRAVEAGGARLALPVLAYAGAMFSKEVGVVGIALVALLDLEERWRGAPSTAARRRNRILLHAGYVAALGAYALAYRAATASTPASPIPFEDNPAAHASTAVRLMTAVAVIGKGLLLQVLPVAQSPDYSHAAIPLVTTPADPRFLASAAALAAWAAAGVRLRARAPVVLVGLGWYLAALLPASNLLFPVGTIFGERLLYLPSVGLALVAGAALAALGARLPRRVAVASAAALALALGIATLRYSAAWADEPRLFRLAAERAPESAKVQYKLAALALAGGRLDEAGAAVERALTISPGFARAHLLQAEVLRRLGRADDEVAALRRALEADPDEGDALYAMGRLARDAGRLDEAAGWWRRAISARPRQAAALADLATYELMRGDASAALALAERAVEADDGQATAWYNVALIHRARGDRWRSRAAFERFVGVAGPEYAAEAAAVRAMLSSGE